MIFVCTITVWRKSLRVRVGTLLATKGLYDVDESTIVLLSSLRATRSLLLLLLLINLNNHSTKPHSDRYNIDIGFSYSDCIIR